MSNLLIAEHLPHDVIDWLNTLQTKDIIVDEPTVPKLYPNGNYNKTWTNEDLDDYLE